MRISILRFLLLLALVLAAGCGDRAVEGDLPVAARFAPDAELVVEGAGELFPFVQIMHVSRVDDGDLLVANSGRPPFVARLGPEGDARWVRGGTGEGPGEFTGIWDVFHGPGDVITVYDFASGRLTDFDLHGELVEMRLLSDFPHPRGPIALALRGAFGDGTFLGRPNFSIERTDEAGERALTFLFRIGGTGAVLDTIGVFPDGDLAPGGGSEIPLFRRRLVALAADERVFIGTGEEYAIREIDAAGREVRTLRRPYNARPVDAAMLDVLREEQLARVSGPEAEEWQRQVEARFRDPLTRPVLPPYQRMLAGPGDELWVQDYLAPTDTVITWSVFRDGDFAGIVDVPSQLDVRQVQEDAVIGIWTDELDVQTVRIHGLERLR